MSPGENNPSPDELATQPADAAPAVVQTVAPLADAAVATVATPSLAGATVAGNSVASDVSKPAPYDVVAVFLDMRERAHKFIDACGDPIIAAQARDEVALIDVVAVLLDRAPTAPSDSVTKTFAQFAATTLKQMADLNSQIGVLTSTLFATQKRVDGLTFSSSPSIPPGG